MKPVFIFLGILSAAVSNIIEPDPAGNVFFEEYNPEADTFSDKYSLQNNNTIDEIVDVYYSISSSPTEEFESATNFTEYDSATNFTEEYDSTTNFTEEYYPLTRQAQFISKLAELLRNNLTEKFGLLSNSAPNGETSPATESNTISNSSSATGPSPRTLLRNFDESPEDDDDDYDESPEEEDEEENNRIFNQSPNRVNRPIQQKPGGNQGAGGPQVNKPAAGQKKKPIRKKPLRKRKPTEAPPVVV